MRLTPINNQNFQALTKKAAEHCFKNAKNPEEKLNYVLLITLAAKNKQYHIDLNNKDKFVICTTKPLEDIRIQDGKIIKKKIIIESVTGEKTYSSLEDALVRATELSLEKPAEKERSIFDYCI